MPMTAKHMFGALAVSAAAAMLAACGRPADPQAAVTPAPAPVTQTIPQAAPDEPLTASTTILNHQATRGYDVQVKGVQACLNAAKEHTYREDQESRTSCIGSNGLAYARFECSAPSGRPITCKPF